MTINRYTEAWCYENYTPDREQFFTDNAYYVVDRDWFDICRKVKWIAPLILWFAMSPFGPAHAIGLTAVFIFSYFLFGVRTIDANVTDAKSTIWMIAAFLAWSVFKLPDWVSYIFGGINAALYIYMAFIKTAHYKKNHKRVENDIDEEDYKAEEEEKKYYSSWKQNPYGKQNSYEQTYTAPHVDAVDPLALEAEKLFSGYTNNKDILKTRYRQLAKTHHPDHGGNEELFKRIVNYYENCRKSFA